MSKSCVTWRDEWMVDIFIHVTFLILVLSVAFWALVAPVEKKAFDSQIEDQIKQAMGLAFKDISQDTVENLSKIDLDVLSKYYDQTDDTTSLWNGWLKKSNVLMAIVLIVTLVLVWAILSFSCGKCIPVGRLLVENFVLFACIVVVEALFFLKVASKFVPVAPSYMVQQLFKDLKTKL
jgi:hypothetical protein